MQIPRYIQERAVAGGAAAATIALTGAAFWLSYEHLAEVASSHGLEGIRAWAWPATIDLFIVVGELYTLKGSLQGKKNAFAIGLAIAGSLVSLLLNMAGVGAGAAILDYIVAGVPPVAAFFAFWALMRQVHEKLRTVEVAEPVGPASSPASSPLEDHQPQVSELVPPQPVELPELPPAPLQPDPLPLQEDWEAQVVKVEVEPLDQATLVEKLVANGEPLPGRTRVMQFYGVSDWTARQALKEAKERLQEIEESLQIAKEN